MKVLLSVYYGALYGDDESVEGADSDGADSDGADSDGDDSDGNDGADGDDSDGAVDDGDDGDIDDDYGDDILHVWSEGVFRHPVIIVFVLGERRIILLT